MAVGIFFGLSDHLDTPSSRNDPAIEGLVKSIYLCPRCLGWGHFLILGGREVRAKLKF